MRRNRSDWFRHAPLVIAHRGASAYAPENTLPAFELAIEQGADAIELDLRLTSDGVLVIQHDASFGPKQERVARTPSHRSDLLSLERVLKRCAGRVLFNFELKVGSAECLRQVASAIRTHGLAEQVLVSSFQPLALRRLRRLIGEVPIGLLLERRSPWLLVRLLPTDFLVLDWRRGNLEREVRQTRNRIIVWTVNQREHMRRLIDLGVHGIITDRPDEGRTIVGR